MIDKLFILNNTFDKWQWYKKNQTSIKCFGFIYYVGNERIIDVANLTQQTKAGMEEPRIWPTSQAVSEDRVPTFKQYELTQENGINIFTRSLQKRVPSVDVTLYKTLSLSPISSNVDPISKLPKQQTLHHLLPFFLQSR